MVDAVRRAAYRSLMNQPPTAASSARRCPGPAGSPSPVGPTVVDWLARFRTAARSLTRAGDAVPALGGIGVPGG